MALSASETQKLARFLNPWTLHLQKIGLELKCPLCLNLLNKPMLLPCNHIFCHGCVPDLTQLGLECAECKKQFIDEDLRPAPHMEKMVKIYRSFDSTLSDTLLHPISSGARMPSEFILGNSPKISEDKSGKEGTSSNRQPMVSLKGNMENHALLNACTGKERALVGDAQDKADQHVGLCTSGHNGLVPTQGLKRTDGGQLVELDMNHEPQPSPGSSNSVSAMRDGDCRIGDPLNKFSNTKICKTRKVRESELVMSRFEVDAENTKEYFCQVMDSKRQKKQSYKPSDYVPQGRDDIAISRSIMQSTINQELIAGQGKEDNRSICAFCHSSKISDGSGEMLHFENGKEVVGNISHHSNITAVHSKCIDWTPQVYYEGDYVKNLESELARAAKLKCDCCGRKGAGLGCFAKSCRKTYHVPCAYEVQECRWDCDDFLLLCPSHSNLKFPREKLNRRKLTKLDPKADKYPNFGEDLATNHISSMQLNLWVDEPAGQREWVFCGSALSSEDKHVLNEFAQMCGAKVTKNWKPNVTHVIAATEANGACRRTLKVLMAILHGKWTVSMDWVKACTGAHSPVDEEPYEFSLDNHGCQGGPKAGRLRVITNEPKLFDGMIFNISEDFVPEHKSDILDLVYAAGGVVMDSEEEFMVSSSNVQSDSASRIVVYNPDPPPHCLFEEGHSIISRRKAEAEDLANKTGAQVVRRTWILESIAACKKMKIPNLC